MGCLNSEGQFSHWFGNIHLSGPCNRSCYFCIGQHMMALDSLNVLDTWPLPGIDDFIAKCLLKDVSEVNLTGSNTDPLLYEHLPELKSHLKRYIPHLTFGLRTNGVLAIQHPELWSLFDKGSISFPSFRSDVYTKMMGPGQIPDLAQILKKSSWMPKINIVLGPENLPHLAETISLLSDLGVQKINVREPYGQPHIGDPLTSFPQDSTRFGMPVYKIHGVDVIYWDVHYVEVESVNLYANGRVSLTYPVTKGHAPTGKVEDQSHFPKSGRVRSQWLTVLD